MIPLDHDIVSVIAGGFSFAEVDHSRVPGFKIAVNDSAVHLLYYPDVVLSMDRVWTEYRWDWLCNAKLDFWTRKNAIQNLDWKRKSWLYQFENDNKSLALSEVLGTFNGFNSGVCAINYAYLMKPKEVYLFGFDMCCHPETGNPYWHAPYPWTKVDAPPTAEFNQWAGQFFSIANAFKKINCKVHNVSRHSKLDVFPRYSPSALNMAREVA